LTNKFGTGFKSKIACAAGLLVETRMEWKRKPPDDEGWGGEILARYERGVMLLLFILAVTIVALITWLGAYFFGI
jgi:hypothetical protein